MYRLVVLWVVFLCEEICCDFEYFDGLFKFVGFYVFIFVGGYVGYYIVIDFGLICLLV